MHIVHQQTDWPFRLWRHSRCILCNKHIHTLLKQGMVRHLTDLAPPALTIWGTERHTVCDEGRAFIGT